MCQMVLSKLVFALTGFLLHAMPFTMHGQTDRDIDVSDFLATWNLDSMIRRFGEEDAMRVLIRYVLDESRTHHEIWYSISAIDYAWAHRSTFSGELACVSLKIKALYWIDLILNSITEENGTVGVLVEVCSRDEIYDLEMKPDVTDIRIKSFTSVLPRQIETLGIVLNVKGLAYMQLNGFTSMGPLYAFERRRLVSREHR